MAQSFYPISFFETVLANSIGTADTTINLTDVTNLPTTGTYLVIEADNEDRREIIYYTGITGTTLTGVIRGLAFTGTDDSAVTARAKAHPAGANIACKDVHYYDTYQLDFITGVSATGYNTFKLGDGGATSGANRMWQVPLSSYTPFWGLSSSGRIVVSEDGINSYVISAGGSGVTGGQGTLVVASQINVNPLSTGGLTISANKLAVKYDGSNLKSTSAGELYFAKNVSNAWTALNNFTDISIDSVQISAAVSAINRAIDGAGTNVTAANLNALTSPGYDISGMRTYNSFSPTVNVSSQKWSYYYMPITPVAAGGGWLLPTGISGTNHGSFYGINGGDVYLLIPGISATDALRFGDNKQLIAKWRMNYYSGTGPTYAGFCTSYFAILADPATPGADGAYFSISGANFRAVTSWGGGAQVTVTNLSAVTNPQLWSDFSIVYSPGTSCGFYVNGILRATHTTTLPASLSAIYVGYGSYTAGNGYLHVGPMNLLVEN